MLDVIAQLRTELARVLPEQVAHVSAEQNLLEVGLHSLAIMYLVEALSRRTGVRLDYADLARDPSLAAWARLWMASKTAGAGDR